MKPLSGSLDAHEAAARFSRGLGIALASALVLSFTGILIRVLTRDFGMPALVLAFWRNLFTASLLALALRIIKPALLRPGRAHAGFLAAFACTLAVFNALWTISVEHAGAALATILVYTSGAFTVVLGRLLLREPITPGKAASVVLCLTGCALVAWIPESGAHSAPSTGGPDTIGMVTGVISGLCYAVYSLMGRVASRRGLDPWTSLLFTFAGGTVILGAVNLIPGLPLPGVAGGADGLWYLGRRADGWLVLVLLAAGPTLAGFGLYNVSLSLISSGTANLLLSVEPLATAVVAWLMLGERLTPRQALGGAIILAGVAVLARGPNRGSDG